MRQPPRQLGKPVLGAFPMAKEKIKTPRFGWALTGSGHFFKETLALMRTVPDLDVFMSSAAEEEIEDSDARCGPVRTRCAPA